MLAAFAAVKPLPAGVADQVYVVMGEVPAVTDAFKAVVVFIQIPAAGGMLVIVGPVAFTNATAVLPVAVQLLASVTVTINV